MVNKLIIFLSGVLVICLLSIDAWNRYFEFMRKDENHTGQLLYFFEVCLIFGIMISLIWFLNRRKKRLNKRRFYFWNKFAGVSNSRCS